MNNYKAWLARWLALGFVIFAGCSERGLAPVEGRVTLDDKPLGGVHVIFFPVGASVNDPTMFSGLTDESGRYVMHGRGGGPEGVMPGNYRVTLTTAVAGPTDDETTPLPPERVPLRYRNNSLEYEVPEGGTKEANFDLKSR
jgi:hypothetical protein